MLPSKVVAEATTFDIMVTDVYATWEAHKQDPNSIEHYNQEDLKKVVENTRNGGQN